MQSLTKAELAASLPATPSPDAREIAPGIYALRVFTPAEAAIIVSQAALSPKWFPAVINAALDIDRNVRDAELLFEEVHRPHSDVYRERLEAVTSGLAQRLAPNSVVREVQLVRYAPGGKYREHRDGPTPGAEQRVLSLVAYLNENFGGGETTFVELGVTVSPLTGVVIAFPPEYLHRADPVVNGKKYVITAWYHGAQGNPVQTP
ncbi:MAG: 2OG-Fe(II) oxygenase [Candidatus Eremiobacteraeota bacterium]|nr:2OG-Fe(II) oxygenase [Candidatus Eremiobacteraeota bacterium]